jgi:hypothetical protein
MAVFIKPKMDPIDMSILPEYSTCNSNFNCSFYSSRLWKSKYFKDTLTLFLGFILTVSGCTIGPDTIERDRFDYSAAITTSWKEQMLLNLVKIRYGDTPVFLEVTSIINQYGLEGDVRVLGVLNGLGSSFRQEYGGTGRYYDRPTITYIPMTGEKFARSLLTPVTPTTIMSFIQSGWPVDFVLRMTCDSINGIRNNSNSQMRRWKGDPEFEELLSVLKRIQGTNAIVIRTEKTKDGETTRLSFNQTMTQQVAQDAFTFKHLLRLNPDVNDFSVIFGAAPKSDKELTVLSRSMLQILIELAGSINVPKEHLEQGQVSYVPLISDVPHLINVYSGSQEPLNAFVAVEYNDFWFWIAKDDPESKRILSLLLLFFSLSETGSGTAPAITVGSG